MIDEDLKFCSDEMRRRWRFSLLALHNFCRPRRGVSKFRFLKLEDLTFLGFRRTNSEKFSERLEFLIFD